MDKKTLERIVKCAVTYNKQTFEFDKKFLEIFDNYNLEFTDHGDYITLKTVLKK